MENILLTTQPVQAIVAQHARDAAFYWSQIDNSRLSSIIGIEKLAHFQRQLNAHLDGLRIAGPAGWEAAFKNFTRWKSQGEAFVCLLLALEANDPARFDAVWKIATPNSDTTSRGLIGTMVQLPQAQAVALLKHWLNAPEALLLEIALRAWGARHLTPDQDLSRFFSHPHACVRAACCQLVGKLRLQAYRPFIQNALVDAEARVREQAALAQVWLLPKAENASALHSLLVFYLQHAPRRGLASVVAQRRMELLARMLGHGTPCGDARLPSFLATLPDRLRILLLAHHGDPAQLPFLLSALNNKATARLAFWAIGLISGLDTLLPELTTSAPEIEENEKPLSITSADADIGLEWPHIAAVSAACQALPLPDGPLLLGQTPTLEHCQAVFASATQATRFAAAWHWARLDATAPHRDTRNVS